MKRKKLKRLLKRYLTHDEMAIRAEERARCLATIDGERQRHAANGRLEVVDALQLLIGLLKTEFLKEVGNVPQGGLSLREEFRDGERGEGVAEPDGAD